MQLLVVEDNPSTLKMLAFLLRNEGYTVHAVNSANTVWSCSGTSL